MSTSPGKRRAAPPPTPTEELQEGMRLGRYGRKHFIAALFLGLLIGAGLLASGVVGVGPVWLGLVGSVTVATLFSAALAARTGGRPIIFGGLALALGLAAAVLQYDWLCAGAAVMTSAVSAVLAVMATVPARTWWLAVRETLIALAISVLGGFAVLGFEPMLSFPRFRVVASAVAFVMVFALVYRLGHGWHAMGRRGLAAIGAGFAVLLLVLTYTVLLQRYGSPELITSLYDGVERLRETLGALPRPVEALIGIPGLMWGTHMRARRGQGWWVSAFGVAASIAVVYVLLRTTNWTEFALSQGYSIAIGIVVGLVLIRVDLHFSGNRGRRARRDEQALAVRPEPSRTRPLFA